MCDNKYVQDLRPQIGIDQPNFYTPGVPNIWLPRQDQLQEMLRWEIEGQKDILLITAFYNFANNDNSLGKNPTWEQLWLAFCMSEKFNLKWTGSEWE